jgi:hypothetical protein
MAEMMEIKEEIQLENLKMKKNKVTEKNQYLKNIE